MTDQNALVVGPDRRIAGTSSASVIEALGAMAEQVEVGVASSLPPFVSLVYAGSQAAKNGVPVRSFAYKDGDGNFHALGRVVRLAPVFLGPQPFWGKDATPPRKFWADITSGEGLVCYSLNGVVPVFDGKDRKPFTRLDKRLGGLTADDVAALNAYNGNMRAINSMGRGFFSKVVVDENTRCSQCQFAQFVRVQQPDGSWKVRPPLCNPEAHFLFTTFGGVFTPGNHVDLTDEADLLHYTAHKMQLNFVLPNPYSRSVSGILSQVSGEYEVKPLSTIIKDGLVGIDGDGNSFVYPVLMFSVVVRGSNQPYAVAVFAAKITPAEAIALAKIIWDDQLSMITDGNEKSAKIAELSQFLLRFASPLTADEIGKFGTVVGYFNDSKLEQVLFSNTTPKQNDDDDVADEQDDSSDNSPFGDAVTTIDTVPVKGGGGDSNQFEDEAVSQKSEAQVIEVGGYFYAPSDSWGTRPSDFSGNNADNPILLDRTAFDALSEG